MTTTIGIKVDDLTRERLTNLGKAKDRSSHWLMKKAIDEFLVREELYEKEKAEDLARWEGYVATGVSVSNEDMTVWLDELADKARSTDK